jgi:Mg-chelatase subunit ChlI
MNLDHGKSLEELIARAAIASGITSDELIAADVSTAVCKELKALNGRTTVDAVAEGISRAFARRVINAALEAV